MQSSLNLKFRQLALQFTTMAGFMCRLELCEKKNIVAKCYSKAESHLYLRYGEIQANARNDIERNDTVSFQAEYKSHAFQLAFECTE